jgi:hypothetical protein
LILAQATGHHDLIDGAGGYENASVATAHDYTLWVRSVQSHQDHVEQGISVGLGGLGLDMVLERLGTGTSFARRVDTQGNALPRFRPWLRPIEAPGPHRCRR